MESAAKICKRTFETHYIERAYVAISEEGRNVLKTVSGKPTGKDFWKP